MTCPTCGHHKVNDGTIRVPIKTYFVTIAANQGGPGYYEVKAEDREAARIATFEVLKSKWSMMYDLWADVHELDRTKLGIIYSSEAISQANS